MRWLLDFINNVLGPISIVVGIITILPVLLTWWEVTPGRQRQYRKWFDEVWQTSGIRSAILIVDLLPERNIAVSVESYRRDSDLLKTIPSERVFTLSRENRLTPNDMPELTGDMRRIAADIIRAGADTVHLFYAGPVVPMALIGAEFANTCRLMLYQHSPSGYENWGPLRHDLIQP